MFLARVTGNVVATQKDKTLNGQKLFVVEPLNVKYDEATSQPSSASWKRVPCAMTGEMVLMSMTREPSRSPAARPPSPTVTRSTSAEEGSMEFFTVALLNLY